MTFGETARRVLFGLALVVCLVAWSAFGLAWVVDLGRSFKITTFVVALVATDTAFWLGAAVLGWTAFANRGRLWRKLTGSGKAETEMNQET